MLTCDCTNYMLHEWCIMAATSRRCVWLICFRFILVDWIVEVASMKQFSPLTVHFAVYLIDHYLCIRRIDRCCIQLLGISCLLLSSRWTSDIILTIRESSWLTEKTFTYDEVVRMMGDLLAAFKGNIRVNSVCMWKFGHPKQNQQNVTFYRDTTLGVSCHWLT